MSDEVKVTMSATVGAIAAAMAKAQREMRPAAKDRTNPHFKNTYATLTSCMEAIQPLHENDIAVFQPPAAHGVDGVLVSTLLIHKSGEWLRGELYMPASKKDAQGFGSALSYARRYCLCSTVGLSTDDDDGNEAVRQAPTRRDTPPAPSSEPRQAGGPTPEELAISEAIRSARTAEDLAKTDIRAGKALKEKLVVNGGRERLLRLRSEAIERIGGAR